MTAPYTKILTFNGLHFDFANPSPDDVIVEDIIHALPFLNRYVGHTTKPYSVAQHLVIVKALVAKEFPDHTRETLRYALIHDAHEIYCGDMPGPLKKLCPEFVRIENEIQAVVLEKLGCRPSRQDRKRVNEIDKWVRHGEKNALAPHFVEPSWDRMVRAFDPMPPDEARKAFSEAFFDLFPEHAA